MTGVPKEQRMTTPIPDVSFTDNQRAVLRALADTVVPSLQRDEDPTGFWAASGSDLGADVGVEDRRDLLRCQRVYRRPARGPVDQDAGVAAPGPPAVHPHAGRGKSE